MPPPDKSILDFFSCFRGSFRGKFCVGWAFSPTLNCWGRNPNLQFIHCAFTLAEVLITLGIIGVVATLTMPTLIQNHRRHVVETRLKHFYSVINEAVRLSEVDNGDKADWIIEQENGVFWDYIKPYLKYNKVEDTENPNYEGRTDKKVYLANGSAFIVSYGEIGFFPEAKNMNKADRIYGRDTFRFAFIRKYYKFHENKGVEPYTANWDGDNATLYSNPTFGCNSKKASTVTGSFCTAVIQRNGWKIPKDYPHKF